MTQPDRLREIQDQLVESFYDPDPADPTPEVDYSRIDWRGVVRDARAQIDKLKNTLNERDATITRLEQENGALRAGVQMHIVTQPNGEPVSAPCAVSGCQFHESPMGVLHRQLIEQGKRAESAEAALAALRQQAEQAREFVLAVVNAIGEISKQEAVDAILREWPK